MKRDRSIPGEAMACAVCKRYLNVRTALDGSTILGYEHGWKMDHEPVPVPVRETLDTVVVCDFCGYTGTTDGSWWTVWCTDWMERIMGHEHWHGEEWATCGDCAQLIQGNQWDDLAWRSVRQHMISDGFTTSEYVKEVFRLQGEVHAHFLRIEKD